jgi:hypothetical protein
MGGNGSGRISGDGKATTEGQRSINMYWLKDQDFFRPGCTGTISWSRNGEPDGLINCQVEDGYMILDYKIRYHSYQDWEPVKQTVLLDRTPCNYGGHRKWFLCPRCQTRVAIIYGVGKYFLCRHCYGLTYESRQETKVYRLMRKARVMRGKLGASDNLILPILRKPKGMHQKTFDRLRREADQANHASLGISARRFGVFKDYTKG